MSYRVVLTILITIITSQAQDSLWVFQADTARLKEALNQGASMLANENSRHDLVRTHIALYDKKHSSHHLNIIKWAYQNGYPRDHQDSQGLTNLDYALRLKCHTQDDHGPIWQYLHDLGIDYKDEYKNVYLAHMEATPLLYACTNPYLLRQLLNWGHTPMSFGPYNHPIEAHIEAHAATAVQVFDPGKTIIDRQIVIQQERQNEKINQRLLWGSLSGSFLLANLWFTHQNPGPNSWSKFQNYGTTITAGGLIGGLVGFGIGHFILDIQDLEETLAPYYILPGMILGGAAGYYLAKTRWTQSSRGRERYLYPLAYGVPLFVVSVWY